MELKFGLARSVPFSQYIPFAKAAIWADAVPIRARLRKVTYAMAVR